MMHELFLGTRGFNLGNGSCLLSCLDVGFTLVHVAGVASLSLWSFPPL